MTRPVMVALALVGVAAISGCAFDSPIVVQFSGVSPVAVTESLAVEQMPHRAHGTTSRRGQRARIDCSTTIVYDVDEATGPAVLAQTYAVHLRTRPLPPRTAYDLDCAGPAIVEIPAGASDVRAASTSASGLELTLPVRAPLSSLPTAFGKRLRAERGMQLAEVRWPHTLPRGDYRFELTFDLPEARPICERALVTASVSCGKSKYVQPILPAVVRMAQVPLFTIAPSANPIMLQPPRIAGSIGSYAEATRTISCNR